MQDALAAGSPQHSLEPARALQRAQKHGQIGWQGDFARGEEGAQHERHTSWFRPRTGTGRGRGPRSNPIDSFVYKISTAAFMYKIRLDIYIIHDQDDYLTSDSFMYKSQVLLRLTYGNTILDK